MAFHATTCQMASSIGPSALSPPAGRGPSMGLAIAGRRRRATFVASIGLLASRRRAIASAAACQESAPAIGRRDAVVA